MPYPFIYPSQVGFEVDVLAVGEASRSGDAIVIRFGDLSGPRNRFAIVAIDGGFRANGEEIATLVRERYGTDFLDLFVSTHPDADHVNGAVRVVENLRVGAIWMHLPWDHTDDIACMFRDGRVTDGSVRTDLRQALDGARILAELAMERGIPVVEPFTGVTAFDGLLRVAGPSVEFYESLLPDFRCTPAAAAATGILAKFGSIATRLKESLDIETLGDDGETSAENNTSAILHFDFDGRRALFTGDAGIPALEHAAAHLEALGITRNALTLIQAPHHGSKHNVGPTILDRLVGPKRSLDEQRLWAVASAAPDGMPDHPAKAVANAFRRRGAPLYATRGTGLYYGFNAPNRGFPPASPLPFYPDVDE